jgi:hypothetical protein
VPDFHIDGDAGAIRSRTAQMRTKGQTFVDTGDALAKISTGGWTGRAADKFADKFDAEPERWRKAGDGFVDAAAALEAYADALDDAKRRAAWAKDEYARGDKESESARSAYDADVSRARQEVADAAAQGTHMPLTILPFKDPGDAIRKNALDELSSAKADLEKAAHIAADGVRAGATNAPEKRKWYEKIGAAVGGFLVGAGEAVWDLLTMSSFSPINMLMDAHQLATGDMTPEELAAKYRMSVESVGDMVDALKEDPAEFGKQLGKGLLDWDTWADDPARALGHLVPDAVAAFFTAGTGTVATRGAKGTADALDALGDIGDANRAIDALHHFDDVDLAPQGTGRHLDDPALPPWVDDTHSKHPDLSHDGIRGMWDYTTDDGYRTANNAMRDPSGPFDTPSAQERINHINEGLDRLPRYEGTTYRGTNLPESVYDRLLNEGRYSDAAFSSSSLNPDVADRFYNTAEPRATSMTIEGRSGVNVQPFSAARGEAEILFKGGTDFVVVGKPYLDPDGVLQVTLREAE